MANHHSVSHVCICAATYLRPNKLRSLLLSINGLDLVDLAKTIKITVVIVDNDPDQSGLPVTQELLKSGFRFPLVYSVESKRGIPQVRNKLLHVSKSLDADVIAMIDDDETVDKRWLIEGLRALQDWNADVLFGHLVPVFEISPPRWIVEGGYFEFPFYKNGTNLKEAYTYNVFFRMSVLKEVPFFDESLSLFCGEDVLFFRQIFDKGFIIKFCSLSVVYAQLFKERMTLKWILKRRFSYSFPVDLILKIKKGKSTFLLRLWMIFISIHVILIGLFVAPFIIFGLIPYKSSKFLGKILGPRIELFFRRFNYGYRGVLWFLSSRVGFLAGVLGYRYKEYAKPNIEMKV